MSETKWLKTSQYAELFQLNEQTVRDRCAAGIIKAKKVGTSWRIPYTPPMDVTARKMCEKIVNASLTDLVALLESTRDSFGQAIDILKGAMITDDE